MKELPRWLQDVRYPLRHPVVRMGLWVNVALALMTVALIAFWWPVAREHQTLTAAVDGKRRQMMNALQAGDMLRAYRHAQVAVPKLEEKLRTGARQSELIDHLGRLAREHNVRVLAQSFEDGKVRGAYLPLQVNLTLQGGYSAVRDLLDGLPSLPVWTEIQEINLERSRESPDAVRAQLRLLTFRRTGSDRAVDAKHSGSDRKIQTGKT